MTAEPALRATRSSRAAIALTSLLILVTGIQAPAFAGTRDSIHALCSQREPDDAKARQKCNYALRLAAGLLMKRIEHESEGTYAYSAAKTCIESAKMRPQMLIDWRQAFRCYKNRLDEAPVEDDTTP